MNKRAELAIAQNLIDTINKVGESVDYDERRIVGKINYSKLQQRKEFGLLPSLMLTLCGLVNNPVEYGQNASDLVDLRDKASKVAGINPLVASELAIGKGRHSILNSDFQVLDPIEPNFDDMQDILAVAFEDMIESKTIKLPKGVKRITVKVDCDKSKWSNFEAIAHQSAVEAKDQIATDLAKHQQLMSKI